MGFMASMDQVYYREGGWQALRAIYTDPPPMVTTRCCESESL